MGGEVESHPHLMGGLARMTGDQRFESVDAQEAASEQALIRSFSEGCCLPSGRVWSSSLVLGCNMLRSES